MREYLLYIKCGTEAVAPVQTYVTPSFSVDRAFWQEREGCVLHVIGKTSSLALAFSLREKINERLRKRAGERSKLTDALVAELRGLAVAKVREASALYGREVERRQAGHRSREHQPHPRQSVQHEAWFAWEAIACSVEVRQAGERDEQLFSRESAHCVSERVDVSGRTASPFLQHRLADTSVHCSRRSSRSPSQAHEARQPFLSRDNELQAIPYPAKPADRNDIALRELLDGRALFWDEVETLLQKRGVEVDDLAAVLHRYVLTGRARWLPGVRMDMCSNWRQSRFVLTCERCGSAGREVELTYCHTCGQGCAYCTTCLGMGRSKCCTPYILLAASGSLPVGSNKGTGQEPSRLEWTGSYSDDQARAAERARRFVANPRPGLSEFLIWAVCGAGKTELLFPSVAEGLAAGGRVLIATPRKDVVLELAPRIQRVFPHARVIAVHGASAEKWEESDITIATTHQVLRYYRRFLLVVLDEADAFPYHNNPVLYRALARAVHQAGKLLYLSATPPRYLQKRLVSNDRSTRHGTAANPLFSATHVLLPGRYHGFPLPVPEVLTVRGLHKRVRANRAVPALTDAVQRSLEAGRQVFVFVPRIDDVEVVLAYLQKWLPSRAEHMAGVHAADLMREEKVLGFRQKRYTLMVTTTILERGVTIPQSDVVVVGAEAAVFDEASLVQIAGRVGRAFDDPAGAVLFLQTERALAPKLAVRQITRMNQLASRLAKRRGHS
ncbi:helicase-related protein [Brevibacillus agri]|uniref:helicase-related protein n=1 Tax=Brevibacillus agri TaxID=51101 RepID=UPI0024C05304|nr:helicase-related protein [Brevibacillus agri]WHX30304.1 helicase-related protein [Brevibacillus agri]